MKTFTIEEIHKMGQKIIKESQKIIDIEATTHLGIRTVELLAFSTFLSKLLVGLMDSKE